MHIRRKPHRVWWNLWLDGLAYYQVHPSGTKRCTTLMYPPIHLAGSLDGTLNAKASTLTALNPSRYCQIGLVCEYCTQSRYKTLDAKQLGPNLDPKYSTVVHQSHPLLTTWLSLFFVSFLQSTNIPAVFLLKHRRNPKSVTYGTAGPSNSGWTYWANTKWLQNTACTEYSK